MGVYRNTDESADRVMRVKVPTVRGRYIYETVPEKFVRACTKQVSLDRRR